MFSRYSAMKESSVKDPVDRDNYLDPLSINYNNLKLTTLPSRTTVSTTDINRFWLFIYKQYQSVEGDDILLTINDVPYLGALEPGDFLYTPTLAELSSITAIGGLI
jgi:hypothetical protein